MVRKSKLKALRQYLPDRSVLDEHPDFDSDISQPLFSRGNAVGCITLHGIGGTPANIRVVADALIARGYTVVSPTLPGHGATVRALDASTGEQWLHCILDAYKRLQDAGCTEIYALGLSLGGILSALLATQAPLDGLALICAPIKMQPFLHMARRMRFLLPIVRYPSDEGSRAHWGGNPYAQMYDGFSNRKLADLNRLCIRLRKTLDRISCPTLFVSAAYDDKVDPSSIDVWKQRAVRVPHTEYLYLENSPHGCTYGCEREKVAEAAASFVARCVKRKRTDETGAASK